MTKIRTGQVPAPLTREQFHERYQLGFYDPAFADEHEAIARLEEIAWQAMQEGRKAPITRAAGRGFADPTYQISVQFRFNGLTRASVCVWHRNSGKTAPRLRAFC